MGSTGMNLLRLGEDRTADRRSPVRTVAGNTCRLFSSALFNVMARERTTSTDGSTATGDGPMPKSLTARTTWRRRHIWRDSDGYMVKVNAIRDGRRTNNG